MGNIGKEFLLLLVVILAASSLMMVESAFAQSIPKPSIPEFTVKFIDKSYDAPATYSTDPYTGAKMLIDPAHRVNNGTIELTITNQRYTFTNGSVFHLYYLIRNKGHYEQTWFPATSNVFTNPLLSPNSNEIGIFITNANSQSDSKYTVITLGIDTPDNVSGTYPPNAKVDFQVQSIVGHDSQYFVPDRLSAWQLQPPYTGYYSTGVAYDVSSNWSETQTITISDGSVSVSTSPTPNLTSPTTSNSPNPTPTPTVPEFSLWTFSLLLIVMVALAGLLVYHKKLKLGKTKPLIFMLRL